MLYYLKVLIKNEGLLHLFSQSLLPDYLIWPGSLISDHYPHAHTINNGYTNHSMKSLFTLYLYFFINKLPI